MGFLSPRRPVSLAADVYGAFVLGMRELGYVEGKNLLIEWHFADNKVERLPELAADLVQLKVDVIIAVSPPATIAAVKNRLPTISALRGDVEAGVLMSYGANLHDLFRRGATYVDKIFKGAKPADLPVEQPTIFELFVNGKTAKTLGMKIPNSILVQATKVIE